MKVVIGKCGSHKATIRLTFDAGSAVEYKRWTSGVAHLVEHMVFQGSKTLTHTELMRAMATLGANWNATTWTDRVSFYLTVPAENALQASILLRDMIFNRDFDKDLFEKEKLVVLEEERGGKDDLENIIGENLCKFLYNGPTATPIIGTEKSIKFITIEEVNKFHKYYYTLDRVILSITGPETLNFKEISNVFGKDDGKFIRSKKIKTTFTNKKQKIIKDSRVNQPRIFICYKSVPLGSKFALPISYFSKFFSEDMDSRLFEKVRQEEGLCYYIGSFVELQEDLGFYIVSTKVAPENVNKAIKIIDKEINNLIENGHTEEEIIRARNKYLSDVYSYLETSSGLNALLCNRTFYGLRDIDEFIEGIKNIKSKEITKAINMTFKEENKQVFIYKGIEK